MIVIDNRTGSKELLPYFPPGTATLGKLEYADFAFEGKGPEGVAWRIGIERKTIRDLLACIQSGRFSGHQLRGLLNGFNEVYLIVEGFFKGDSQGVLVTYEAGEWRSLGLGPNCYMMRDIWLWLNTEAIGAGIHWNKTANPRETASFVSTLYRWWTFKEYEGHRSHLQPNTGQVASLGNFSLVRRVASQLSGIGWEKRSRAIESAFDSIEEMVHATESDWQSIEGIGKKLSQSIMAELKGESE